mmetsp:Transcript_55557/g.92322  ORF Transcript_55557/g.92322 Transcript_55557/m.92322 type:complete len:123 (-) Transcript_55557:938-1306(-)
MTYLDLICQALSTNVLKNKKLINHCQAAWNAEPAQTLPLYATKQHAYRRTVKQTPLLSTLLHIAPWNTPWAKTLLLHSNDVTWWLRDSSISFWVAATGCGIDGCNNSYRLLVPIRITVRVTI